MLDIGNGALGKRTSEPLVEGGPLKWQRKVRGGNGIEGRKRVDARERKTVGKTRESLPLPPERKAKTRSKNKTRKKEEPPLRKKQNKGQYLRLVSKKRHPPGEKKKKGTPTRPISCEKK